MLNPFTILYIGVTRRQETQLKGGTNHPYPFNKSALLFVPEG